MRRPWFFLAATLLVCTSFLIDTTTGTHFFANSVVAAPATANATETAVATKNSTVQDEENLVPQVDDDVEPTVGNTSSSSGTDSQDIAGDSEGLNFLELLFKGGWFMIPLVILSILVISLAIERALALRQEKMLPSRLVDQLGRLASDEDGFDPRAAYQICQQNPSAASKVVKAMLLRAGRPLPEIEHAASECAQREATKLHNVASWLTLAAAVAPLIGLLGTVWGITQAFYETIEMAADENKSKALAEGIYTALVTTMCGLAIAMPAAVLAHLFENRIVGWFSRIEEMVLNIVPQLEPLEGRFRTGAERKVDEPARRSRVDESGNGQSTASVASSSSKVPR